MSDSDPFVEIFGEGRKHMEDGNRVMPSTSWALLVRAVKDGEDGEIARALFIRRYRRPVHAYLTKIVTDVDTAEDLTQEFFTQKVVAKYDLLGRADPKRGTFREYLKAALRNFVKDAWRQAQRRPQVAVQPDTAPGGWDGVRHVNEDVIRNSERTFDSIWTRVLLTEVLAEVREYFEAKHLQPNFAIFIARQVEGLAWGEVEETFKLTRKQAQDRMRLVAKEFRRTLRRRIAFESETDQHVDDEIQQLINNL